MIIPSIACMILFVLHPIGRTVWYYSLFWTIPIFIALFKSKTDVLLKIKSFKVYAYALGSAYVDHAIGSIIYLYYLNIPAKFWTQAIPLTFIERLIIAGGITLSYFSVRFAIKSLKELAVPIAVVIREREKEKEVTVHEK